MIRPKIRSIRPTVTLLPMCMTLLATAVVIQDAYALRSGSTVDDEVLSPIMYWIHPAAIITLLAGYGISAVVLILSMKKRSPKY